MLPGLSRTPIVVAAVLAMVLAGVRSPCFEVPWPGTSIGSALSRGGDARPGDDSGRLVEQCEEDQDDEDDREITLSVASLSLCRQAPAVAFIACHEHRPHGSWRPSAPLVRGPPAAL